MFDSPDLNKCFVCGYERPSVTVEEEPKGGVPSARRYCLECALKAGIAVHDWAIEAERREKAQRKSK